MERQIGIRVSASESAKLERLAERTGRNISQVFRLLLAQARAEDLPDIRLDRSEEGFDIKIEKVMERHGVPRRFRGDEQ